MASPFLGEIRVFGFNFPPVGWLQCNGQTLSISQFSALFALLGTTYGGNGTSTFSLPDLRGRFPIHAGQGPGLSVYSLGEQTGSENVTLLSTNMPQHTHIVNATTAAGNTSSPSNAYLATPAASPHGTSVAPYASAVSGAATLAPQTISAAGSSLPFSILPPLLCLNFCICTVGMFPSRG
jgi:microcystin-dependent protein